jgi:hypothetical protein
LVFLSISLIVTRTNAQMSPAAVVAGGDTCASPTVIASLPYNDSGDTTGAVDNIRLTGCAGFLSMAGADHIYTFNVFSGNNLTFTLTPTDPEYDPSIYIRTACAQGSGTCVARTDAGNSGAAEILNVSGLAPGTYYFFVDSIFGEKEIGGFGTYTLSVTGTFGTPNSASLYTVTPCRVLDTRDPTMGGPALSAGVVRTFTIAGKCQIPLSAKSISANVTVTQPTGQGHLVLFPAGGAIPDVSTINFRPGQTRANNAILSLGAGGNLSVVSGQAPGNTVHVILDVNGYFQ